VQALLAQGYRFLDVRSEIEFALGHTPGAFNVPLMHAQLDQLVPNRDFASVVRATFPPHTPLVVGCNAIGRARRACAELEQLGFTDLVLMSHGWDGERDAFGRLLPGWSRQGLPIETGDGAERGYTALHAHCSPRP
jgi:rhodanese-related sulfurtransferase